MTESRPLRRWNMITYDESVAFAKKLKTLAPGILGIELFGSVATKGKGRDADFLVLVEDALARRWWEVEHESIRVRWPDGWYSQRWIVKRFLPFIYTRTTHARRNKRLLVSAKLLGIDLGELAGPHQAVPDFEMFLVPPNWRVGAEPNMEIMGQITNLVHDRNTTGFLKRVARDAIPVA